jgi:hypothetical protein
MTAQNSTLPSNAEADLEDLFPWYASTAGPGVSMTLFNIIGTLLPMINLALASNGIQILPGWANLIVTFLVFAWFAGRAAYGYVRAKKMLGARAVFAEKQVASLQSRLSKANEQLRLAEKAPQ